MKTEHGRYAKIVEWSDEDACYVGTCPGLFFGGVHGQDEMKVYKELRQMVVEHTRLERKRITKRPRTRRSA